MCPPQPLGICRQSPEGPLCVPLFCLMDLYTVPTKTSTPNIAVKELTKRKMNQHGILSLKKKSCTWKWYPQCPNLVDQPLPSSCTRQPASRLVPASYWARSPPPPRCTTRAHIHWTRQPGEKRTVQGQWTTCRHWSSAPRALRPGCGTWCNALWNWSSFLDFDFSP